MRSLTAGILCLALSPLFGCGDQVVGWEVPDSAPPMVISTTPVMDATDVARNAPISATFSEPMDPATIDGATFLLEQGADSVPGVVMYVGLTAIFTPNVPLASDTRYTATITTMARDLAGNALEVETAWTFSTGDEGGPGMRSVDLGTLPPL